MLARLAAALLFCAMGTAVCSARTLQETDYRFIAGFENPVISPDGRYAATIVSRVDWNEDRRIHTLLIADVRTRSITELLRGRKGIGSPLFSPDGTQLAVLAEDANERDQIYVMPAAGGALHQVTHAGSDVDEFAWRPDGRGFAYTASDPEPHLTGAARFRDSFIFTSEPITERERPQPLHLFVQNGAGAPATQLTFGERSAEEGGALSWSPDGTRIAFVICPTNITDEAVFSRTAAVDVRTRRITLMTSHSSWEGSPLFSPDGRRLAYTYSGGDSQFSLNQLYVAPALGGDGNAPWAQLDRVYDDAAWLDARTMIGAVYDGTTIALYRLPLGGAPKRLSTGDLVPGVPGNTTGTAGLSGLQTSVARDGSIAFVGSSPTRPLELYVRRADGTIVQLTSLNTAFARTRRMERSERFTFPTTLGIRGDGVLFVPPGFSPHRKYPLVVFIHGGPGDPSMQIFDFWAQTMAARGWLVMRPNYRGTPNLGAAYLRAIQYDPEDGPGKDIMAALDTIRARGIVDDTRLAVSGWSYGGIMTAWMISKYHVWKAAVSGASVNDWITDYGTADDSTEDRDLLHGSPFVGNEAAEWRAASAITYAGDVTTPVLILSDVGDNRDPFATSSMYWRALRDNHKDATLRVWPIDGHFPSDPVRTVDVFHYWLAYIGQHFR